MWVTNFANTSTRRAREAPHNVYINGRFYEQRVTGVQRYARELVNALDSLVGAHSKYAFTVLVTRNTVPCPTFQYIACRSSGHWSGQLWEQFELPIYVKDALLVNLCNLGPLVKRRQLVTIHDASTAALPANYSRRFRWWYNVALPVLCRQAKRIITDSDFSKMDIHRHFRAKLSSLRVVPLGVDHIGLLPANADIMVANGLEKAKYVLAVSSTSSHKNIAGLIQAMQRIPEPRPMLVIAGSSNEKVFASVHGAIGEGVKQLGYVSDAQLRALYEGALCFVYPSFYEGFGLPPGEAMACGCPTVVSDIPALRELCGDAALYCNPADVNDIADKIGRVVKDGGLRQALSARGRSRASPFTWRRCAEGFLRVIDEAMGE